MVTQKYNKDIPGSFQFQLTDVPFSRKLSYLSIGEKKTSSDRESPSKQLYLSRFVKRYRPDTKPETPAYPGLIDITPIKGEKRLSYTATASPSVLSVETQDGFAQLCFDQPDLIRIRGKNIDLRFSGTLQPEEIAVDCLNGTYQICYDLIGEFLFVPLKGKPYFYTKHNRNGCIDFSFSIVADTDGYFEICLHYSRSCAQIPPSYRPFEECIAEVQRDYEDWYAMYPRVLPYYEYTKRISVYGIWICYVAPGGILKDNAMLFQRNDCAFSWHSAYNAMAMVNNPDMAVHTLMTAFSLQDEYGEIPDMFDDSHFNILATKPPFHGAAVLYMMEHFGDQITQEHCALMYDRLARWCTWWLTFRDTDRDGVPQYNQGCESGIDTTVMLSKGVPAECPDLISYVILLEEALGHIAKRLGKDQESKEWFAKSKKLLHDLVNDFWDGNKFIARVSSSHVPVEPDGLEGYAPVMLGARLPQNIIEQIAGDIEKNYMTDLGLAPLPKNQNAPIVFVDGFDQLKFCIGLYQAGKTELAVRIMTSYCEVNVRRLPSFGYLVGELPEDPGIQGAAFFTGYGRCSSLSGCIFLTLAGLLSEITGQDIHRLEKKED